MRELFRSKEPQTIVMAGTNPIPETGIIFIRESNCWEVWYKGVRFAEMEELKEAHDRLQKLLALDTTK